MDRLVFSISCHTVVSATDHQMAPGALHNCNLDFVRFEISLFIAFDKFVHVIFLFFFCSSSPTRMFYHFSKFVYLNALDTV